MQGEMPFFETPEKALDFAVSMLGGPKKVAGLLWPDRSADASARYLAACLLPMRAEKLDLSQTLFILRAARDIGCYAPFQWFAAECGFDARPVTRAEETDRATAALEAATKAVHASLATLERLQRGRAG